MLSGRCITWLPFLHDQCDRELDLNTVVGAQLAATEAEDGARQARAALAAAKADAGDWQARHAAAAQQLAARERECAEQDAQLKVVV